MVNLAWIRNWGTLDFFVMPFFRERTFPGADGRLRLAPSVDPKRVVYGDGAGNGRVDLAVRWFHTLGAFDIGISHFYGTTRDPRFLVDRNPAGIPLLVPVYEVINQTGVDLQMTRGGWLWKLETMTRSGQGPRFGAATGGFEYTFPGAIGTADVGLITEYSYDSRGRAALTLLQNDVFVGTRIFLNDVQSTGLLAGGAIDLDTGSLLLSLEAERRLADGWVAEVEARVFSKASPREPLWSLRRDDHLRIALAKYF
jgi:hypothetical protein